ncbi:hypothetical protein [Ferruginibacter sp. SUN106]|uniref:hypothetical protein n=1 Tax=Ferruginibacter sp. SUN106 TaxID=2978348 RepID=UPI003D369AE3
MQQQDHVWQLIAGYLTGEASAEALQELQQIVNSDPDLKNTIALLADFWQTKTEENSAEMHDVWAKHLQRIQQA